MIRASLILIVLMNHATCDAEVNTDFVGRHSCASATCHGGVVDRGPAWNSSLTKWLADDPHAGAGLLLRNDKSKAIVVALDDTAHDSQAAYDSVLRHRCITCHGTTNIDQSPDQLVAEEDLAQGVSCEACHGPASQWLDPHTKSDWAGPQHNLQSGARDNESILGRAQACLRCHVGSRTADGVVRDVNHDLIAAGHPALRFDLLLYNENLPKHWDKNSAAENKFNQSALRVRAVGRASSLAAAAKLAGERAIAHPTDSSVPWPELSDYDCFACHQSLSISEYRLPASDKNRLPLRISDGLPIWNSWHTIGQLELAKKNLQALAPNRIAADKMAIAAMNVAERYRKKAEEIADQRVDAHVTLAQIRAAVRQSPPLNWHHAAVQYLDSEATLRDLEMPTLLTNVEPLLRFDRENAEPQYDSPAKFDAVKFQQALLKALSAKEISPALP